MVFLPVLLNVFLIFISLQNITGSAKLHNIIHDLPVRPCQSELRQRCSNILFIYPECHPGRSKLCHFRIDGLHQFFPGQSSHINAFHVYTLADNGLFRFRIQGEHTSCCQDAGTDIQPDRKAPSEHFSPGTHQASALRIVVTTMASTRTITITAAIICVFLDFFGFIIIHVPLFTIHFREAFLWIRLLCFMFRHHCMPFYEILQGKYPSIRSLGQK